MSTLPHATVKPLNYQTSAQGLAEPFMADVEEVFSALDKIADNEKLYRPGDPKPSPENINWAKRVLLRVLPSYYLRGAEIEPLGGEIHATWEGSDKRVVAYFPRPDAVKVYYEQIVDGNVAYHDLKNVTPAGLSGILAWFFKK
jgi:hypothetical protein